MQGPGVGVDRGSSAWYQQRSGHRNTKHVLGVLSWLCAHTFLPLASNMNSDDHGQEAGTDVPWGCFGVARVWQYAWNSIMGHQNSFWSLYALPPIHPELTASSFRRGEGICSFYPASPSVVPGSDQALILKSERGRFRHCYMRGFRYLD